ncbi:MAG: zinc-ribbon domain-containing protein, partial [Promethearchaeota archaeon]
PEEISTELKKILMDIIHDPDFYERMRNFLSEYSKLIEKLEKDTLSDQEREIFMINLKDLMNTSPIHLNLYENLRAFKDFFYEHSVWNPHRIDYIQDRFISFIVKKFEELKGKSPIKNPPSKMVELINSDRKLNQAKIVFLMSPENSRDKSNYSKNSKRFLIAIDKNSRINRFPKDIRMEICSQINELLNQKNTKEQVLKSILEDLDNGSYWNSEFDYNDFDELKIKSHSEKYREPLKNYFKNLIDFIQFIKNNPNDSARKVSMKFPFINLNIIREIGRSIFRIFESSKIPFSYQIYVDLCNERDDLVIEMTKNQFQWVIRKNNSRLENHKNPRRIKLIWKCASKKHTWSATFSSVGIHNSRCPKCVGVYPLNYNDLVRLWNERDDLERSMSKEEFENDIRINDTLLEGERKSPSQVKLNWKCKKRGHVWIATYSNVKRGHKCPHCFYTDKSITYSDYLELGSIRDDLDCTMSKEEFENTIRINNNLPQRKRKTPSQVGLLWKCLNNISHENWIASYNSIKQGSGCFFCGDRIKTIGQFIHPILEYYSLKLLVGLYNYTVSYESQFIQDRQLRPDLIIERNDQFKNHLECFQCIINFPEEIKSISIDFTFGLNRDGILKKCNKQYHSNSQFLLIVMLREDQFCNIDVINDLILDKININHSEHIRAINYSNFLDFLGIFGLENNIDDFLLSDNERKIERSKRKILNVFKKIKKLALESIESDSRLKKLKDKYYHFSDKIDEYDR